MNEQVSPNISVKTCGAIAPKGPAGPGVLELLEPGTSLESSNYARCISGGLRSATDNVKILAPVLLLTKLTRFFLII